MHKRLQHLWRSVTGFFLNMDAQAWRSLAAGIGLLALVVAVIVIGKSSWGQELLTGLEHWMEQYRNSPLALLVVVAVFCVAALFGAPQFVLIAACVVAFGPWWGGVYSWAATVISAALTFYIGHIAGSRVMQRVLGKHADRMAQYIGRNAFSASFIIRNIPSAPFIVVNMAFGAARAPFPGFMAGCALGIIPKTALVALFGSSLSSVKGGNWKMAVFMAVIAVAWLALMVVARKVYEAAKNRQQTPD